MKVNFLMVAAAASALMASSASAQLFTAGFETDQSANFVTTVASSTSDANANFVYNSSTHVQAAGTAVVIPVAPSGAATNNVLRLNANVADATDTADAVAVYPIVTGQGTAYVMTFDAWQNYNGDSGGGTGSTNMFMVGATDATSVAPRTSTAPSIAGTGFYFTMSGENGASADYRFYSGSGTIAANNAGALWLGNALNTSGLEAAWTSFFTSPTYQTAGVMGKAWTGVRLTVDTVAQTATLAVKVSGGASYVDVATASGAFIGTSTKPFVGFSDINAGLAINPGITDQFTLIDNLTVDNVSASVGQWELYN